ncbi:MAG TPA: nucleoside-diphosphate sugar epimerase/dehydratase [Candidatus Acidoferrales bacterium]|nr:nucleoside-diphosphate sugar epimerase/dehydratase [Candidatus Acidoferrales bacterium]
MKKLLSNLPKLLFENRPWFIALFQALLVLCSLVLAWLLRFNFSLPFRHLLMWTAPILILIRLGSLRLFNLHRGWWHFSGVSEALNILKAAALGTVCFYLMVISLGLYAFPRSVYLLEAVLTVGLLSGGRLMSRVLAESMRQDSKTSKKVIIIGAGFAAQMVIREIAHSGSRYSVLGCLDDDESKRGIAIHGVTVLGKIAELPKLLANYPADEVVIAIPSATGEQILRFIQICQGAGVAFRTVPALSEIIKGHVSIRQFREVRLEDLLGREPVEMDLEPVRREIEGRVVLVTGAAGSIGSELCHQIQSYAPRRLVCVDQNETGLFYLQQEFAGDGERQSLIFCVADISDETRMRRLFQEHGPSVVFHAAAYKHVPMMEANVQEAVKNNVFGLVSLVEIADDCGCESFILISSDKAVNPTSVMGATKRMGELILGCRSSSAMRCISVRFGNVLGSNGSVVPLLQQQLESNRPLTITHPEIKRFFMTTREAVALVLEASTIGEHGDILVLEMGKQIPIVQLARTLIQLSGKTEDQVKIHFTGLRPGEKLFEEMSSAAEDVISTDRPKIKRVRGKRPEWPLLSRRLEELRASLTVDGAEPVRSKLREILPEYIPPARESVGDHQKDGRLAVTVAEK